MKTLFCVLSLALLCGGLMKKLNPMVTEDKMCRSKRRYATIQDAASGAARVSCGKPKLFGYQCPFCDGYHLTKFQRPLDPALKDRINIDLTSYSVEG